MTPFPLIYIYIQVCMRQKNNSLNNAQKYTVFYTGSTEAEYSCSDSLQRALIPQVQIHCCECPNISSPQLSCFAVVLPRKVAFQIIRSQIIQGKTSTQSLSSISVKKSIKMLKKKQNLWLQTALLKFPSKQEGMLPC